MFESLKSIAGDLLLVLFGHVCVLLYRVYHGAISSNLVFLYVDQP